MIFDSLDQLQKYGSFGEAIEVVKCFLNENKYEFLENGKHMLGAGVYVLKMEYQTKKESDCIWEGHRKYNDLQILIEGSEQIFVSNIAVMSERESYNDSDDYQLFDGRSNVRIELKPGYFALFTTTDIHKTSVISTESPGQSKKISIQNTGTELIQPRRILILSDSLALPRNHPEAVVFEETRPQLLKNQSVLIHQVSIGGATIHDLFRQIPYHINFKPDLVIVQVGIVDCAPRFATKFEQELLKRIPIIGSLAMNVLNRPIVRQYRNVTYTSKKRFMELCKSIDREVQNGSILVMGIIPASEGYEKQVPGISKNIAVFNEIFLKVFNKRFLNLDSFPGQGLMSDHHHLNKLGHRFIFELLLSKIA